MFYCMFYLLVIVPLAGGHVIDIAVHRAPTLAQYLPPYCIGPGLLYY